METTRNDVQGDVETINTSHGFSSPWHFSDVVLAVEDTKFHVHKSTLSMWSPVFEAMFTSQFLESTAKEIPLPGKRADEVEKLLKMIYSDDAKQEVTDTNYELLLDLAREYQMDRVKQHCGWYMKQGINEQNCFHLYNIAERFGLEDVMKKCSEEACFKSSTELEGSHDFCELGLESKFTICMARMKELEKGLTKYAEICSNVVGDYYEEINSLTMQDVECINKSSHSLNAMGFGKKDFDSSCSRCRERINLCRLSEFDEINVLGFPDLFKQLCDLEHDDKMAKIIERINTSEAVQPINASRDSPASSGIISLANASGIIPIFNLNEI